MGILDDAIRDHLELKRRRGADPAEVERAEREALGPVRRQPDDLDYEDDLQPGEELVPGDDPLSYEDDSVGYEPDYDDEPVAYHDESPAAEEEPAAYRSRPEDEPDWDRPVRGQPVDPDWEADEPRPEGGKPDVDTRPHETLPPEAGAPAPPPIDPVDRPGEETAEHDVNEQQTGARDDVLEETPEFLQDTPDHDRLWFEQKPPRDFDFDG